MSNQRPRPASAHRLAVEVPFNPAAKDVTAIFTAWMDGKLAPQNERQTLILQLWHAFLKDQPADFDNMVRIIPNHLDALYKLASEGK
jgi:hypothetical protein